MLESVSRTRKEGEDIQVDEEMVLHSEFGHSLWIFLMLFSHERDEIFSCRTLVFGI